MNILGINCFSHDTSAALLKDGQLIAFAEEERFNREKHTCQFPNLAIEYCLQEGGLDIKDIEYVAFPFIPSEDLKRGFRDFRRSPATILRFAGQLNFDYSLSRKVRLFKRHYRFKGETVFVGHHDAHIGSSFYGSPFEEAALMSLDRGGDYISTMLGQGKGNKIFTIAEINNPHSLGSFYSCITNYLGFKPNGGEGKVMGLAPYGRPTYYDDFKKLIKLEEGGFKVDLSYFTYHLKGGYGVSHKFVKKFGLPRQPESSMTKKYEDIAWAVQKVTEDTAIHLAIYLYEKTKLSNLCLAGGLALNGVMNHAIKMNTPFKEMFIQPAANDGGASIGAVYCVWYGMLENPRKHLFKYPFLGPYFKNGQIEQKLDSYNLKVTKLKEPAKKAAELLRQGKIIGWFQGKMEAGPRALGNRSILADPTNPKMKDHLNKRVKHRESFRPFAPAVLEEEAHRFFDEYYSSPFMLTVLPIKKDKRSLIPAVCHVDNTGRLQTVDKETNPMFYELINEFYKLSDVPVILNTSFNVRGEPIVCSVDDALHCFTGTELDALIIGDYLVEK